MAIDLSETLAAIGHPYEDSSAGSVYLYNLAVADRSSPLDRIRFGNPSRRLLPLVDKHVLRGIFDAILLLETASRF